MGIPICVEKMVGIGVTFSIEVRSMQKWWTRYIIA